MKTKQELEEALNTLHKGIIIQHAMNSLIFGLFKGYVEKHDSEFIKIIEHQCSTENINALMKHYEKQSPLLQAQLSDELKKFLDEIGGINLS